MRLQQRTDYALRVLIQLALIAPETSSVRAIGQAYGISSHHLLKVAQRLRELGYVRTVRGARGGFTLAVDPRAVRVGEVLRQFEDPRLVECFSRTDGCVLGDVCVLQRALRRATAAFYAVLDDVTLADLIGPREELLTTLRLERPPTASRPETST